MTNENQKIFNTILKKWGTSSGIIIPKLIMKDLDIIEGDELEIVVKKINELVLKKYRCLLCNYEIEGSQIPEDNQLYCPSCNNEDKRGFEEILNN